MYENLFKEDLWQFGFDASRFKKIKGGREWHGPCPWCGGNDRMVIFNGVYWCRQCGKGGKLVTLLKEPPSPEEMARLQAISDAKAKKEAEQRRKERDAKLKALNRSKPWIQFHKNLLDRPDILQLLEKDGIDMPAVEWFQLGFMPDFHYAIADGDKTGYWDGPVIVFPIRNGAHMHNLRMRVLSKQDIPDAPLDDVKGDKYRPFLSGMGASFLRADFPDKDWVVIVEGEKKAIVCWRNGIPAIGIQGCWTFKEEWIPWFKARYKHIYLALDPDQSNHKSEERLAEMLGAHVIHLDGKPDDLLVQQKMTIEQFAKQLSISLFTLRR